MAKEENKNNIPWKVIFKWIGIMAVAFCAVCFICEQIVKVFG